MCLLCFSPNPSPEPSQHTPLPATVSDDSAELVGPPGPPGTYGSDESSGPEDDDTAAAANGLSSSSSGDDVEGLMQQLTMGSAGSASKSPAAAANGASRAPRQRGQRGLSFEALLDDLVVLSFLVSVGSTQEAAVVSCCAGACNLCCAASSL